jgi:hypothetical protein
MSQNCSGAFLQYRGSLTPWVPFPRSLRSLAGDDNVVFCTVVTQSTKFGDPLIVELAGFGNALRVTFGHGGCRLARMNRNYTREALLAAAESPHDPSCLTRKHHVPTDGLCNCHVGKARFALDVEGMSMAENVQLLAGELLPAEKLGPVDGYETAYHRALVKRAKKMGIRLD